MLFRFKIEGLLLLNFFTITVAQAGTFKQIAENLSQHVEVTQIEAKSKAMSEEASMASSWGDPRFQIAARNFPKDTLKNDTTPMTGIEFGLSQKIALSTKYGNIGDAQESMSQAVHYEAINHSIELVKSLWELAIMKRKALEEKEILSENLDWITKILDVSKKRYGNGKISQQAVLEIEIRKSEIESELSNKKYELSQISDQLNYLTGEGQQLDFNTVPWSLLNKKDQELRDHRELAMKAKVTAKELSLTAAKQNYLPDLMVSVGYTKRSNIDGKGDFVGASVSFPLPFSSEKYSQHGKAAEEKLMAQREYENYELKKKRDLDVLHKEIEKIKAEIYLLESKTIKFARNSRTITSKSYGLGHSTYVELLQAELKLQSILMKKTMLTAQRDSKLINLKYMNGESLYE